MNSDWIPVVIYALTVLPLIIVLLIPTKYL